MPIAFEIVCPDQQFLSATAEMVVIPAAEGDMGVMEGHTPMIVALRGGVVATYDQQDRITERWFVTGGFAEVTAERCVVLATEVIPAGELRADVAERRLAEAEAACAAIRPDDSEAQALAQDRAQAARAMLDTATA